MGLQVQIPQIYRRFVSILWGQVKLYGGGFYLTQKVFSAALCGVSESVPCPRDDHQRACPPKKSIRPDQSRLNYLKRWFTEIGIIVCPRGGPGLLGRPRRSHPGPHLLADE